MNNLSDLETFISSDRASTYRRFSPSNDVIALSLYCWNTEISSELFKVISNFEIYLRNTILYMMDVAIDNGIFNTTFLGSLDREILISILKKVKKIDNSITFDFKHNISGTNPIPELNNSYKGKVASEMNLFFWEDIFNNQLVSSSINLTDGFPFLPKNKTKNDIKDAIFEIRKVRNRICHNEHLLNVNIRTDVLDKIFELLAYISPELVSFEREKENVSRFLKLKPI